MTCSCVAGSRRGSGEEPGSHGLHLCGLSAITHLGVSGGVEYGELGGDLACRHCRVSRLSAFMDAGALHFCFVKCICVRLVLLKSLKLASGRHHFDFSFQY